MTSLRTKPDTGTAHTPGPWAVHLGYELVDGSIHPMTVYTDDGKGNGVIIPDRDDFDSEWRNKEALANACLIAAAPELLAALAWFIADIDGSHTKMVDFDANVERARAAIAKAEGRQP